jgi:hypothetical protein
MTSIRLGLVPASDSMAVSYTPAATLLSCGLGPLSISSHYPTHSASPRTAHSHLEYANTLSLSVLAWRASETSQTEWVQCSQTVRLQNPMNTWTRGSGHNRTTPTVLQSIRRGGKLVWLILLWTKKVRVNFMRIIPCIVNQFQKRSEMTLCTVLFFPCKQLYMFRA